MNDETATAEVKRGPGRPPKSEVTAPVAASKVEGEKKTAELTYIPRDPGDPHSTTFGGIAFRAYVPVAVALTHSISAPIRIEHTLADGTIQTRSVDKRVSLVELARGNTHFSVDGVAPQDRKVGQARTPANSDEYRGYAISWIAQSTSAPTMDTRWDAEEQLRDKCGCDSSDIAYLRPFFEAQREANAASDANGGVKAA